MTDSHSIYCSQVGDARCDASVVAVPDMEHAWLTALVGRWHVDWEAPMSRGQRSRTWRGEEEVRSLGGLWILCDGGTYDLPGLGHYVMTLGFDGQKGFVGTLISSSRAELWVYKGELDRTRKILTLCAEGRSMTKDGAPANYKDTIELVSDDERILRCSIQARSGTWEEFMKSTYRRVK